ncbi:MAG: hypothetical protein GF334_12290 [Candidatus Altiarchaeales archaeon]|nr:hypothetical protein [Candidatus Altiarchaeales archaeon]
MEKLFIPVDFIESSEKLLEENLDRLRGITDVGVAYTAQHRRDLPELVRVLETSGFRVPAASQILGCDRSGVLAGKNKLDAIIFVGSGFFHPVLLKLESSLPVYLLNPHSKSFDEVSQAEVDDYLLQRKRNLGKAAGSKVFGVLVSTKTSQFNLETAFKIRNHLIAAKKKAYIFAADNLTPLNLDSFKVDCWINTACPRICEDEFRKPVIGVEEFHELF